MTEDEVTAEQPPGRFARWGRPAAFAAAGLVAGGLLAGTVSASADDSAGTATQAPGGYAADGRPGGPPSGTDQSQPQRPDEQLLTGSTADKVKAAALAEYPGATVVRVETDSDGVYEAHLTRADGTPVTVEVDKSFTVTGTELMGPGGPGGMHDPGGATGSGGSSPSEGAAA